VFNLKAITLKMKNYLPVRKRINFVQERRFFFKNDYFKKKVYNLSLFCSKIKSFESQFFLNYFWLKLPLPLLTKRRKRFVQPRKKFNKRKFKNLFLSGLTMSSFIRRLYTLSKKEVKYCLKHSRCNESFSSFLELRLDVLLFKVGFFSSVVSSRQAIVSGFIFLNNKKVVSPSFILSIGDCVSLSKKAWFLVNYLLFRSFIKWRRSYRYNLLSFYSSNFIEVDFSRLRVILIKRFSLESVSVYSFKPTWFVRWYIFRNKGQSFFDYNFLYRFLKKN
jgi:hypothetical protein